MNADTPTSPSLSHVLIALFKEVLHAEEDAPLWQSLLNLQARVRDHLSVLGLELVLDESEGFAFLKQRQAREGEPELPRLIQRRPLSYPISLLLALLRKRLLEFDARGGETRLILGREEIIDLVRQFHADVANSAKLQERIAGHIGKVAEMGFLRRLRRSEDQYEVSRVLKAFIDAEWLQGLESRLAEYKAYAASRGSVEEGEPV
jgi:hypothetical protein